MKSSEMEKVVISSIDDLVKIKSKKNILNSNWFFVEMEFHHGISMVLK